MSQPSCHSAADSQPCNCVDLSGVHDSTSAGVYRGPNLTFSSQANFHDNNNTSASEKTSSPTGLHRAFRWRPSAAAAPDTESGHARPADQTDTKPLRKVDETRRRNTRGCVIVGGAEFLATALLMFFGCAGAYIEMDKKSANVYGSCAFGLAVYMSTTIFGDVSGAHMNPLVTILNLIFGKLSWFRSVVYITAQTGGALVGYGLLYVVIPEDVQKAVQADSANGLVCCTVPLENMSSLSAIVAEFVVTSVLLSFVCTQMNAPPGPPPAFKFGLVVAGICTIEAMYTGASMNPARSVAAAVWNGAWDRFWVYIVGQAVSLAAVAGIYGLFRASSANE